jgi:hypothetical protein
MTFNEPSNAGLTIEETSHEEASKFEITDLVNIFIGGQKADEEDTQEWLQSKVCESGLRHMTDANTVKPVLNGISRVQNIFLLKSGFRLIKVYYNN